jgi:hypothetical protein
MPRLGYAPPFSDLLRIKSSCASRPALCAVNGGRAVIEAKSSAALLFRLWRGRKAHEMRSDAKPAAIPPLVNVGITSIGRFAREPRIPVTGMYDGDVAQNPHDHVHRLGMRARIGIGDALKKRFAIQQGAVRGSPWRQTKMDTPQSQTDAPRRTRALAKVTVQSSHAIPYDQTAGPRLLEVHLSETFTGDIDGESPVRALQVRRDDGLASLVSVQRFRGKLHGRAGTFVLQGQEIVENGKIRAEWFVVPGSGTGDLCGLRGTGGFAGDFGKGSDATLDYWFECANN